MFISVVSHGHGKLIAHLDTLSTLVSKHTVILTDNVGEEELEKYCLKWGVHYLQNKSPKGFGDNNNQNYDYAEMKLNMTKDDFFLVLNPDVKISTDAILEAEKEMCAWQAEIATINLYKSDKELDANVRRFPKVRDFFESYLYKKNKTIINKNTLGTSYVDWASGSFLLFKSKLYKQLSGFDNKYFMYCEDLDICRRALSVSKQKVLYISSVKALHIAAHNNRKLFSKHFVWHVKSVFRYCFLSKY
ncbi:glycosyltransferase family 2 protein [Enterobacter kobei]|uniref:glycosyltransferase family 2 protein n=1 Tax=Enterobacter kobei TaxID=208224 RepID=UPI001A248FD5|nr:glycosyltransferase family 2 protein [Enterobacter kobei]GHS71695.1 rhamnosyltransferase WbbL [Enterobacter kobei]